MWFLNPATVRGMGRPQKNGPGFSIRFPIAINEVLETRAKARGETPRAFTIRVMTTLLSGGTVAPDGGDTPAPAIRRKAKP